MKRIAILALMLAGCRVGEATIKDGGTTTPTANKPKAKELDVRVGIKVDTAAVMITTTTAAELVDRDGRVFAKPSANDKWTFTADETGTIVGISANGESASSNGTPITVRLPDDGFVRISDKIYRGDVVLRIASPGKLTAINVLQMEHYLLGVVPFEIGRTVGVEAMKAQAVAARTYAVGNMNNRGALGFDFYNTVADQVYGGTSGEDSLITRAVLETRGEIITHAGRPILAYYSSTCAGHTADVNESWPWAPPQPYLKGKPDTDEAGEAYCKTSSRFRWTNSWRGDSLRTILQTTLGLRLKNPNFKITRVEDVRVTGTSKSGRAEAINITADGITYRVPADSIRWTLRPGTGPAGLNSSLIFDMKATQTNGEVSRLEVRGGGWGHAIGMCQVGAINRAKAGQNYRQILTAYYTDVQIERLY